jgi:hypothetical protein
MTFSSSRRRLQRAKPSGAGERVSAINFASATPSKIRGRAELGLYLRLNTASNPSSTSWRLVRSIVPFVFSTGYGKDRLLDGYRIFPVMQKPFHRSELEDTLAQLLARKEPTGVSVTVDVDPREEAAAVGGAT